MKNIFKYCLLTSILLMMVACDSYLDKLPDNRAELDTEEKIVKLLVSAYPTTWEAYMYEMMSDNTDMYDWNLEYDNFQEKVFNWQDISDNPNDSPARLWGNTYRSIASANVVLQKIEELGDPQSMRAAKGEALLCRAYGHFILANSFCLAYGKNNDQVIGIPYSTQPETTVFNKYDRGTLKDVYEKIDADLQTGLPLINNNLYSVPKYHFNVDAARAFACQFYLFNGDFNKAIEYATGVLGNNPASRLRDWKHYGGLSTNQMIQPTQYMDVANASTLLVSTPTSNWSVASGPYLANNKFAHSRSIATAETIFSQGPWGNQDSFYVAAFWNESVNKIIFRKVGYFFEYTDVVAGIGFGHSSRVHFTTDETLLLRAEAYILSGQYAKAYEDMTTFMRGFNKVEPPTYQSIINYYTNLAYDKPMQRSPKKELHPALYDIQKGTEQEYLLHYLLHIKRILTLHEGQRWLDVKRYGITLYRRLCDRQFAIINVMDTSDANDLRRAIQLPPEATTAGMEKNPR